jgi:hypothetical protein
MREEYPALQRPRARVKHGLSQCRSDLCEQRHDPIAVALGAVEHQLAGPPSDIFELQLAQLPVTQACSCQRQQHRAIAYT